MHIPEDDFDELIEAGYVEAEQRREERQERAQPPRREPVAKGRHTYEVRRPGDRQRATFQWEWTVDNVVQAVIFFAFVAVVYGLMFMQAMCNGVAMW